MRYFIIKAFAFSLFVSIGISCNEEDDACVENLESNCGCGYVLNPVCDCNGKTYANGCEAQCAGITDFTMGECK